MASVIVDGGPSGASSSTVNTLYTSVTICVPGTSTCQTIDHIQVDTGSTGFRVLASVLTLPLSVAQASNGNALLECTQFVDGYSWGPLSKADIQVSGEKATGVPIQIIGSSSYPNVPSACSSMGQQEDTVAQFHANGIIGIGVFEQDCGAQCVTSTAPGFYYSCTSSTCAPITVLLVNQVQNPVSLLPTDNNGTIILLPAPSNPAVGAATVTGSLIFGIDTQTNNVSGSETVLALDDNGEFATTFAGRQYSASFVDSGSNGYFFTDTSDASLVVCSSSNFTDFYCPSSTLSLSATLTGSGAGANSTTVNFAIGNAQTMANNNPTFASFPDLGGTYSSSASGFDWGLPFFYGRRVANAIENHSTTVGTGPYVAF